ncbi:hypothetical protein CAL13_20775 [Bordetella genomosp. 9]|uniref:Protein kinase domain-containing protein n=2 Tax=Bordetella genomosp. 9 TaxID=1416803 RepID=A0A1W6Z5K9_9BORD|nr:hypothetical protein CAL13_20775 [Bordetella genomosp. 9]
MGFGVKTMSVSTAFVPETVHPTPEPFGYRPLAAIAAAAAGGVPQKRIGRVLSEIAPALVALHEEGRVHGAISVHTVGLDEFGHAHVLVPALYPDHPASMEPASCFAAVEQFDPDPVQVCGPWTDVYAVCAVMCSLVSGSPPPHALARRAQEHYVPLTTRKPRGYDEHFLSVIDRGLSLAAARRPASIVELCELLGVSFVPEAIAEAAAVPPETASGGDIEPDTGRDAAGGGRRRAAALLAVIAGALAVAGIWTWTRQDDRTEVTPRSVAAAPRAADRPATSGAPPAGGAAAQPRSDGAAEGSNGAETSEPWATRDSMPRNLPPTAATAAGDAGNSTAGGMANAPATGSASSGSATGTRPAQLARATLRVDVLPWGEIFVDGVSRGVSPPLKTLTLPPGRHTLEIRNADLPPYRVVLELKAGRQATVRHDFR